MDNTVVLTAAHWIYLLGVAAIVATMILRANVVVPAILATFLVAWSFSGSLVQGMESVFNGSLAAAKELFNIFLVIALMTALLNSLKALKSDIRMVEPFRKVMVNGHAAYVILAVITYFISLFFWPTPAVPLVGAILIPAAILAGLPAMGTAMAVAIAGQGMALSSDYMIKVAPGISAKAAGIDISQVADKALLLSLVTGLIALALGYLSIRKGIVAPGEHLLVQWEQGASLAHQTMHAGTFDKAELAKATERAPLTSHAAVEQQLARGPHRLEKWSKLFALVTPLVLLAIVVYMILPRFVPGMPDLKGGDAAALVGGCAVLVMILATLSAGRDKFLDQTAHHITEGFVFAFKAMGSVLPIAGFFFIGAPDTAASILGLASGAKSPNLLFDLIQAAQAWIPHSKIFVTYGVLLMGMITGIDGSGFAGLPLTGTLSGALGRTLGIDPGMLCAVGQMGAVWTGGGTLVAWSSLIAVTGFARVPVLDAVRMLFLPVVIGLACSTLLAVMIW
jgi:hypothetical protein